LKNLRGATHAKMLEKEIGRQVTGYEGGGFT